MTIPRMEAIARRWDKVPPLSISVATVAAAMGVEIGKPAAKEGNLQELVDMVGAVGFSSEKPAWLTT